MLVDTLDDAACRAYDAWPDRLYLIGRDGRVAYEGPPGPEGFDPDALEQAIVGELAGRRPEPPDADPRRSADVADESASAGGPRFRCGDAWLPERLANDYHSLLLRWWTRPARDVVLLSTCDRATTERASAIADATHDDLVRIFGRTPEEPGTVLLLRSLEQYNAFAITSPNGTHVPPESSGRSGVHHAFPCESWFDPALDAARDPAAACAFWDTRDPIADRWGPFAVRHATAHAFVERLDPSPDLIGRGGRDPNAGPFDAEGFWREKAVPLWLRYGAASYVERFFVDDASPADPTWAQRWSLEQLAAAGGLGELDALLACELDAFAPAASRQRILAAGAVVAFVLHGDEPTVTTAHDAVRAAVASPRDSGHRQRVRTAIADLEDALRGRESALRAFVAP